MKNIHLGIIVVVIILLAGGVYLATRTKTETYVPPEQTQTTAPAYKNEQYGFYFDSLPVGWTEYAVVVSEWQGRPEEGSISTSTETGPEIILKDARIATSSGDSWQDIPVMIYTIEQWSKNLIVSAAPVPPTELGRNNKYVFALPPRAIGFKDSLGIQEVSEWLQSKPLKTFDK